MYHKIDIDIGLCSTHLLLAIVPIFRHCKTSTYDFVHVRREDCRPDAQLRQVFILLLTPRENNQASGWILIARTLFCIEGFLWNWISTKLKSHLCPQCLCFYIRDFWKIVHKHILCSVNNSIPKWISIAGRTIPAFGLNKTRLILKLIRWRFLRRTGRSRAAVTLCRAEQRAVTCTETNVAISHSSKG